MYRSTWSDSPATLSTGDPRKFVAPYGGICFRVVHAAQVGANINANAGYGELSPLLTHRCDITLAMFDSELKFQ